ncbi:SDR family oxidoreductase [Microbacterium sp. EST19A]|uniref:SDR family oxidoreductase n=1 Tax=Microbacterium sp. EST19A TaxID=2862681 RepID=UPI001CBBDAF7|nr:SDR family oxidoreductase [Microbacterium sp. EST19A]
MTTLNVLLVGGTGSIGRHVARAAENAGHSIRILSRRGGGDDTIRGDLTDASTLAEAVDGVDAVVFTHGTHGSAAGFRDVDYGGVRNVLEAIGDRPVRIALMTAIGVTYRDGEYNRSSGAHDWKRRGERLVRASGKPYTIVRPSWFDYNEDDEHELHFLQGDTRTAGSPADGVIARAQLAEVLVASLTSEAAVGKTFELVAEKGPAQADLDPLFAALDADTGLDGARDVDNLPVSQEPADVIADLDRIRRA